MDFKNLAVLAVRHSYEKEELRPSKNQKQKKLVFLTGDVRRRLIRSIKEGRKTKNRKRENINGTKEEA